MFNQNILYKKMSLKNLPAACLFGQGIIQTKMEVSIQFWVPNLGLSPKYD